MKELYRRGDFVVKTDKSLDDVWRSKFCQILKWMNPPAFYEFIPNGYVTKFIEGEDLHGESFEPSEPREVQLNTIQRERIIKIFKGIVRAGIKTGYTLADFTKKNIILNGDTPYLIDYDVIIEGDLNQDYIDIFQEMLDYLEVDYRFNGNLKQLYENIH